MATTSPSFQELMDLWQQSQSDSASELDFMNQQEQQPGYFEREIMRTPEDRSKEILDQYLRMNYGAKPGAGTKKNILPTIAAAIGELGKSVSKGKDYVNPADAAMKAGRQEYQSLLPYASREADSRLKVTAANKRAMATIIQKKQLEDEKNKRQEKELDFKKWREEQVKEFRTKELELKNRVADGQLTKADADAELARIRGELAQQTIDYQDKVGLLAFAKDPQMQSAAILDTNKTGATADSDKTLDLFKTIESAKHPVRARPTDALMSPVYLNSVKEAVKKDPLTYQTLPGTVKARILPELSAEGWRFPKWADKSAEAIKAFGEANAMVDQIEQMAKKVVTARTAMQGKAQWGKREFEAWANTNPDARTYRDLANAFTATISRDFGEKGVLTEGDRKVARESLPKFDDTVDSMNQKLGTIRGLFMGKMEGAMGAYGSNSLPWQQPTEDPKDVQGAIDEWQRRQKGKK